MIEEQATLKKTDGTILATIPLPRSAADISLVRYISFLNELKKLELPEQYNPMQVMAQAVSEVSGVELGQILIAKVGEQWQQDKQLDGGVRSLYGWFTNALTNYKGGGRTAQNFEFQYKGETYRIPYIVAAELAGLKDTLPPVDVKQAIEALEVFRIYDQEVRDIGDPEKVRAIRIKQLKDAIAKQGDESGAMANEIRILEAEIEINGDPNGSLLFSRYLRLIAILAPKEGQTLPNSDTERELEIQRRMIHLQDIDAKTALDIDFFLISLLNLSGKTNPVVGSLILPLFALAATTQSRERQKKQPTIKRYRTNKKLNSASGLIRL